MTVRLRAEYYEEVSFLELSFLNRFLVLSHLLLRLPQLEQHSCLPSLTLKTMLAELIKTTRPLAAAAVVELASSSSVRR